MITCMEIVDDNGLLAVSDEDKKIIWKSYHEKLLNTEFALERNSLSQADVLSSGPLFLEKDMAIESVSKMEN